jgi:hypothetical protein
MIDFLNRIREIHGISKMAALKAKKSNIRDVAIVINGITNYRNHIIHFPEKEI